MDAPVQASSSSRTPFIVKDPILFEGHPLHPFSQELIVEIFNWVGASIRNCALVCKGWNSVIPDSIHKRYAMRMGDILPRVGLFFKADYWPAQSLPLPSSLNGHVNNLFYSGYGISSFASPRPHMLGCLQLQTPDLICSKAGSICEGFIVLGSHQGTYFLQSSSNSDELIITKDLTSPANGETISIENLIFNGAEESNGTWCCPLSNEKIVFLSFEFEMADEPQINVTGSIVDLNLKTTITRKLLSEGEEMKNLRQELDGITPIQLGKYFILNNSLIDLENLSMTPHEFEFAEHEMTVYGTSLYVTGDTVGRDRISSYFINSEGKLEKEWGIEQLKSPKDKEDIYIQSLQVNDHFIALHCSLLNYGFDHPDPFQCIHFLDKKGMCLGEVKLPAKNSLTMHLMNDILIYKAFEENYINFWHIPTQQLINQFPWNGSHIIGIQSTKDEVVLLSANGGTLNFVAFPI